MLARWLDLERRPTLMEWLATDAYYDNLYRSVRNAYEDGYRGIVERAQALKAAKDAALEQMSKRTG